jgi:LuxR family transcriptional regulator, maltose regulon positive regulatory protein
LIAQPRVRLGEPPSRNLDDFPARAAGEPMANSVRKLPTCDDLAVGHAEGPENGAGRAVRPVRDGIVLRPGLLERLGAAARVTVLSAPAGSGKTVLLRSWIGELGPAGRAAWVPVTRGEQDPQRFWLSVLGALRGTAAGSRLVRPLTAAPNLDGWAVVERLLKDLAPLADRLWLVIDDLHELRSAEALAQLELLVMRSPPELRFVLATRHDLQLRLHRLRLEGELTEIRAADLRFSVAEARELLAAAGVALPEPALAMLHQRAEGWAAGLRLAALSLAGREDPELFAAQFSGSERTVAEYLLAEVLERQPAPVRRLLLRTSVLERVSGPLADALTGGSGGEQALQQLEQANAFVVSLDVGRSWFRYHHLFTDLLQLELRRAEPGEVTALHEAAAGWFAEHGLPTEAIGHAQAAGNWALAARLLADHWPGLQLDGQAATVHALLAGFPAEVTTRDAELATVAAADELAQGSLEAAERYLRLAERGLEAPVPARRGQAQLLLGMVRLLLARQRGNLPAVAGETRRLQALWEAPDTAPVGLGQDLRALALISLGITEFWATRLDEAQGHLADGVALARRIARPYLEFTGLANQAALEIYRSFTRGAERARQAVELAEQHGWTDEPPAAIAYMVLAHVLTWQGRLEQAEAWLQRAERTVRADAEPVAALGISYMRGLFELVHGRDAGAITACEATERLAGSLVAPHVLVIRAPAFRLYALVRLGDTQGAERALTAIGDQGRESGEVRIAVAALRLAQHDPDAATAALAPVLDGSVFVSPSTWLAHAFVLQAIIQDALGDPAAADRAVGRALDLAGPVGALSPFLLYPAPGLLQRHARPGTRHAAVIAEILSLLPAAHGTAGTQGETAPPGGRADAAGPALRLIEPLSQSEIRVLRYMPTNLTTPEIASELSVSVNTVRTHIRHVFVKLGTHSRTEAVARARALGLLAPSPSPLAQAPVFNAPARGQKQLSGHSAQGRDHRGRRRPAGRRAVPPVGGPAGHAGHAQRLGQHHVPARRRVVPPPPERRQFRRTGRQGASLAAFPVSAPALADPGTSRDGAPR